MRQMEGGVTQRTRLGYDTLMRAGCVLADGGEEIERAFDAFSLADTDLGLKTSA